MNTVRTETISMLPLKNAYEAVVTNFPFGHMPPNRAVIAVAYKAFKKEIDSGQHMDVIVSGKGTVSFRFTPSVDYPECGISGGTFIPLEKA